MLTFHENTTFSLTLFWQDSLIICTLMQFLVALNICRLLENGAMKVDTDTFKSIVCLNIKKWFQIERCK